MSIHRSSWIRSHHFKANYRRVKSTALCSRHLKGATVIEQNVGDRKLQRNFVNSTHRRAVNDQRHFRAAVMALLKRLFCQSPASRRQSLNSDVNQRLVSADNDRMNERQNASE